MDCPFCDLQNRPLIAENAHAVAIFDSFPVSKGHALIVSRRHVNTIDELDADAYSGCFLLARQVADLIRDQFQATAFNLGVNSGETAGQTIAHAHIHVIPRYPGDVEDPRGGVRHVIPGKGFY